MIQYDFDLINSLWGSSKTLEGGIFNNSPERFFLQVDLIQTALDLIQPKHIVEIGTNKSNFIYLVCEYMKYRNHKNLIIDTYDIDPECINGIQIIREKFPEYSINFHCGNSLNSLYLYPPDSSPIDLFYVDGHHSYSYAKNDMEQAIRLNSKYILVDDMNDVGDNGGVPRAAEEVLKNYKVVLAPHANDERKMTLFGI